jgi:hypothetical protein
MSARLFESFHFLPLDVGSQYIYSSMRKDLIKGRGSNLIE